MQNDGLNDVVKVTKRSLDETTDTLLSNGTTERSTIASDEPESKKMLMNCGPEAGGGVGGTTNVDFLLPSSNSASSSCDQSTKEKSDGEYFKAYGELDIHRDMLADDVRTFAYRRAILANYDKFYKKVVLDLGCGTGILSMFCVQAGASKVYAVDASDIAEQARAVIKSNRMENHITVYQGRIEDIVLPEKVDVIVSEWMGYMLLYEAMLPSVIYARDRWLNKGGYLFPDRGHIYMAPLSDPDTYEDKVLFWASLKDHYKVDMSAIIPFAKKKLMERVVVQSVHQDSLMAAASRVFDINLYTITAEDLMTMEGHFHFECFGQNSIHAFVLWFTVEFPGHIVLSTSPYTDETHWQQTVLYLEPFEVNEETVVHGRLKISPSTINPRYIDINLRYDVHGRTITRLYLMNDYI